jgi:outer membrane lipoprotein SlyB
MYTEKRPQLYPNEKLSRTSSSQAQADIDRCMALADSYVKEPDRYADIARQGLIGGIVGAGTGTVAGTIMGEAGEGTGAGAAVGGILGVLKGLSEVNERTPSYERFVEHCLQRQGYEVLY